MTFEIPILKNSDYDLSKFDFSFISVKILEIKTNEFKEYIKELNPNFETANFTFFKDIIEETQINEERFAIIFDDYKKFNEEQAYNIYKILLILFPSGLQIDSIIHFRVDDEFIQRAAMSKLENPYVSTDDYLFFEDEFLPEANEYIQRIFNNINYKNYIGLSIENYIQSFNASHLHFSYLALCMSLENLIYGNQELSYRLKRTVSILCGISKNRTSIIFKNLGKIYNLRSKIIHGESYSNKEIFIKIDYLKKLVSRVLIELLIHNIGSNKELDIIITELGFGQRHKISKEWKLYTINTVTFHETNQELI